MSIQRQKEEKNSRGEQSEGQSRWRKTSFPPTTCMRPHGRCKRSLLCTNPDFLPRQPIQFVLSAPHQRPSRSPQWKDTLDNTSLGLASFLSIPSPEPYKKPLPALQARGCYQRPLGECPPAQTSHNQPSFV